MRALQKFFINGIVLTGSSFFLRAMGVAFNAFVSQKLGADGIGLFTLIMSVYGLAVTVAASGVNLAATRMCAEAIGRGERGAVGASIRRCTVYALSCGVFASFALFFAASYIAECWLGDPRCTLSLKLLAVSLPFIALSNVFHGYFTAVRKAPKSAATQIFEQIFKIAVTVFGLLLVLPDIAGVEDSYNYIKYACAIIVGGGALAEIASFIIALMLFVLDRKEKSHKKHSGGLTRQLFKITVPVSVAAYLRSGLTTLEHVLIPKGLRANPISADAALASYGVLCGMAMPIIMFPTAFLYSFTGLLIPEFSEAKAAGSRQRIKYMASRALGLTLIFSVGCATVMWIFSDSLGMIIYNSKDAGEFIGIMAPLIPLMYLDHSVDAMLKGLGEQLYCMKINILDAALSATLVYFLCSKIGIYGYVIVIYIAEAMNVALSLWRLVKVSGVDTDVVNKFVKPIGAALTAVAIAKLLLIDGGVVSVMLTGTILMGVYILCLTVSGAVTEGDILWARGIFKK